ncbi:sugar transporter [Asimina triloba]
MRHRLVVIRKDMKVLGIIKHINQDQKVTTIGFAADIGYLLGDTKEHCSTYKGTRVGAAIVFIVGFWMLDLANNTVQGPARALLADLSGTPTVQGDSLMVVYCVKIGTCNGYSHVQFGTLNNYLICVQVFLSFCTLMTLYFAKEIPLAKPEHRLSDSAPLLNDKQPVFGDSSVEVIVGDHTSRMSGKIISENSRNLSLKDEEDQSEVFNDGPGAVLVNLLTSMRHLPPAMHSVLVVMALSWLSWFPFILFDTDWMGREVYHGDPNGNASQVSVYDKGVREGAFGLLLNSVVLGICSLLIEPMCRCMGSRLVWAMSNFTVFICMTSITVISLISVGKFTEGIQHVIGDNGSIKTAALVIFSLLGFPLAITYSVPFSVTAEVTADTGGGQGLAIGVLNLAIVIPQIIVSLGTGPWDALFGGGNIPAFALASLSALAAGVTAILKLPNLSSSAYKSTGFHFG